MGSNGGKMNCVMKSARGGRGLRGLEPPPLLVFFYSARMELNIGAEFLLVYTPFNLFPMVIIIVIKYPSVVVFELRIKLF